MRFITLRLLFIMVCLGCLIGLGQEFAGIIDALPHTTRKCLEHPNRCDGIELGMSVYVVESIESPKQYTIGRSGLTVSIVGDSSALSMGDRVSVKGRFTAAPVQLTAETLQVHRYRTLKELFGILTLLVVGRWLYHDWSISKAGLNRA